MWKGLGHSLQSLSHDRKVSIYMYQVNWIIQQPGERGGLSILLKLDQFTPTKVSLPLASGLMKKPCLDQAGSSGKRKNESMTYKLAIKFISRSDTYMIVTGPEV